MPVPEDALTECWPQIRSALRRAVSEATWQIWLEAARPARLEGTTLVVEVAAERQAWIAQRYGHVLQACAATVLGPSATVEVAGAATPPAPPAAVPAGRAGDQFNPLLTFEQFVIGKSNRLAHAAALAVAELPGLAYNPLFICGPPGLGKTHLLHSIANYVTAYGGGLTVRYTTAEAFTNHFVEAVRGKGMEAFKATYRGVDVLLVDDVQFLQSKAHTEQEFFHTFNALHDEGAQLVLTSDRPPRDLDALEDRLRARFEAGLVADVRAPDRGTRLTILRKRAAQDRVDVVEPAALELIADRVTTNIRTLEGALIRAIAFSSLTHRPLTEQLVREVLDDLYPGLKPRSCSVRQIQEQTCAAFGIAIEDMLSSTRAGSIAWPRQVAMYLARELTDNSLPAIASEFGGRSHTTVLHAYRRTAERIASDRDAYDAVRRLTEDLR